MYYCDVEKLYHLLLCIQYSPRLSTAHESTKKMKKNPCQNCGVSFLYYMFMCNLTKVGLSMRETQCQKHNHAIIYGPVSSRSPMIQQCVHPL